MLIRPVAARGLTVGGAALSSGLLGFGVRFLAGARFGRGPEQVRAFEFGNLRGFDLGFPRTLQFFEHFFLDAHLFKVLGTLLITSSMMLRYTWDCGLSRGKGTS